MLPSLSDRSNLFVAVSAAVAVALCNVMFATDWVNERPVVRTVAALPGVAEPPIAASPPLQPALPAPPAQPAPAKSAAPPKAAPPAKSTAQAPEPKPEPEAPAAAPAETPPPLCDVDACTAAYRTFRASDCTYAPSVGVRRLCTKGKPPQ